MIHTGFFKSIRAISASAQISQLRLIGFCLIAAAFVPPVFQGCSPGEIPEVKLESINKPFNQTAAPCSGKERCLIAFLTPWCPTCRASTPFVKALRTKLEQRSSTAGLMVIVGQDRRPAILEYAKTLGGLTFIDDQNIFSSSVRFSSVPHWWVIDKERKITASGAGFPVTSDSKIVQYYLEEEYGIKDQL